MRAHLLLGLSFLLAAGMAQAADAPLTDVERATIEHDCERILIQYAYYNDANDLKDLVGLYAKDAVLDNAGGPIVGRDTIAAYLAKDLHGTKYGNLKRHVVSNVLTDVIDHDHARGTAFYTVYYYSPDPAKITTLAPTLFATLTNEFVRTPEGWRYQSRKVVQMVPAGAVK